MNGSKWLDLVEAATLLSDEEKAALEESADKLTNGMFSAHTEGRPFERTKDDGSKDYSSVLNLIQPVR